MTQESERQQRRKNREIQNKHDKARYLLGKADNEPPDRKIVYQKSEQRENKYEPPENAVVKAEKKNRKGGADKGEINYIGYKYGHM